jgi:pimeloyl-ACP methyl ester carboxylesterase
LPGIRPVPPLLPAGAEEFFVEIDGARMRYLRAGSGPALVLVHGLMGYSFSWRYVIPALSPHATVYAVDLVGTGFSDHPPDLDCRLRPSAERLLQFLQKIGISTFDLLGTSHGGAVAIQAAAMVSANPELQLRRLILVAPVNPWSPHGRWLAPAIGSRVGAWLFMNAVAARPTTYPWALRRLYGDPNRIPPGTLEGYAAPAALPGFLEYGVKIAGHWTALLRDLKGALPNATHYPTLLMWGERDRAVYVSSAEPLRKQFPNSDLIVFPGIGHLPYEEAADDFNRALICFLTAKDVPEVSPGSFPVRSRHSR